MNKNFFVFILLAIYHLLKTDFSICGSYLFESHRSPQMYDQLTAYFSNRVIRMLRNGICIFNNNNNKKKHTNKLNNVYVVYLTGHNCLTVYLCPQLQRSWRGILLLGCSSVRPSVRSSRFLMHSITLKPWMLLFWNFIYGFLMKK